MLFSLGPYKPHQVRCCLHWGHTSNTIGNVVFADVQVDHFYTPWVPLQYIISVFVQHTKLSHQPKQLFPPQKTTLISTHQCNYLRKSTIRPTQCYLHSQWQLPAANSMTYCITSWPKPSVSTIFMCSVQVGDEFGISVGDLSAVIRVIRMFYLVKHWHYGKIC